MIGDMLYRQYLAAQEKGLPEAKTVVGGAGENEAYDLSQARDTINTMDSGDLN